MNEFSSFILQLFHIFQKKKKNYDVEVIVEIFPIIGDFVSLSLVKIIFFLVILPIRSFWNCKK